MFLVQAVLVGIVLVVALIAQIVCAPYRDPVFNSLEVAALACAALVVQMGLLFQAAGASRASNVVGTICVAGILIVIASFVLVAANLLCA